MHSTLEFLIKHGYVVLLAWVFAEQLGLPVPSLPVVLAAGALSGTGQLSFWSSLFFVSIAALSADSIWYMLGRRKGIRILQFRCAAAGWNFSYAGAKISTVRRTRLDGLGRFDSWNRLHI